MKQALHLRLGQHLTMTPQLQQAIRLLQLSSLELRTEIQEALESNLMLEAAEDGEEARDTTEPEPEVAAESRDADLDLQREAIPEDLPVDSAWEDIYDHIQYGPSSAWSEPEQAEFESQDSRGETLHGYLQWQANLSGFSDVDAHIAFAIIDSISEDGYFTASIEEIHQSLATELPIEPEEVEAVLRRIQHFDPPGVGARDLCESLILQLEQSEDDSPLARRALELLGEHFQLLAKRDYTQLKRRMRIEEAELIAVIKHIQSLNPRPGAQITDISPEYIVPDVVVHKHKGGWRVELNADAAPRVRINTHYASLMRQVQNRADNTYMKNQLQEARWFIKSLQSRNETLLKVAREIVNKQKGFLEYGEEAMKALVLHNIAEELGMHESTISRVTTKKYMHTPRGIFELKYFFSSHVATESGGECSATAIRAFIKKLIAAEDPGKPLSDSKIADILAKQGIKVARRTIAKYREALAIPSSNERKRLA